MLLWPQKKATWRFVFKVTYSLEEIVDKVSVKTWDRERTYVNIPISDGKIRAAGYGSWDTLAYDKIGKCFSLRLSEVQSGAAYRFWRWGFGEFPGRWASSTLATYSPSKPGELPKSSLQNLTTDRPPQIVEKWRIYILSILILHSLKPLLDQRHMWWK